jgi:tRNA-specific 2-thiouridylase
VQGRDHPLLWHRELSTEPMHWLAPRLVPERCTVKVRHRQTEQRAVLDLRADGTARIVFEEPQRAVTPGQYAVVYGGTRCLGGGVIDAVSCATAAHAAA